jgi:hypothetical protein
MSFLRFDRDYIDEVGTTIQLEWTIDFNDRGWYMGSMHMSVTQISKVSIPSLGSVHRPGFETKMYGNGRTVKNEGEKEKQYMCTWSSMPRQDCLFSILCNSVLYMLSLSCFVSVLKNSTKNHKKKVGCHE